MNWNRLKVWFIVGCVLVFLLFLGRACWLNYRFEHEGVEITGVVTRVYSKIESRSVRGSSYRTQRRVKEKIFYVEYLFTLDGCDYTRSQRLGRDSESIGKGDSIRICYLPDNPGRSRLAFDGEGRHIVRRRGRRR
ncbi:MAG: DUF3592 domain-containing protein [Alistipes sp.]|nr:DUF3592 domain-containing protein [Alistipes sp.]